MNCSDWFWFCASLDEDILTMSIPDDEGYEEDEEPRQRPGFWVALETLLRRSCCRN